MGFEETKTYKVRLCTYPESAGRLKERLEKFYRRRARSVVQPEPGRLEVTMRNGARISCRFNDHSGWGRYSSEPIAEMLITATADDLEHSKSGNQKYASFLEYSESAARVYAMKANIPLRIEIEEQKPKK